MMSSSPDLFSIVWRREKSGSQWFFKSPLYEVGRRFRGGDRMKTLSETHLRSAKKIGSYLHFAFTY